MFSLCFSFYSRGTALGGLRIASFIPAPHVGSDAIIDIHTKTIVIKIGGPDFVEPQPIF